MQTDAKVHTSTTSGRVQGVSATSGGLITSTLAAAAVAGAILTFAWLPAEYGIDPSGVGHVLGLTRMGDIKQQLHAEADADAAQAAVASTTMPDVQGSAVDADVLSRLDAIDARLVEISAAVGSRADTSDAPANTAPASVRPANDPGEADTWRDEFEYTLVPGNGIEVKLVMEEGATADFEWTANGSVLNHDTHGDGDGDGQEISYEQGRSIPEQAGTLTAAFTGRHGWFWRNRTEDDVVVTLRTRGDYQTLLRP